jgi:hypothetical protein
MARYTGTLVFEAGPGTVPRGPDVLDRLALPDRAVHRSSYCDGSTLTVVVDFRSAHPASVCRRAVEAVQRRWAQVTGVAAGPPVSVRVRPLRPPQPVPAGVARSREYAWRRDGDGDAAGDGRLVLLDAGSDPVSWPNGPVDPDDPAGPDDPDDPNGRDRSNGAHEPRPPRLGLRALRIGLPVLHREHRGH